MLHVDPPLGKIGTDVLWVSGTNPLGGEVHPILSKSAQNIHDIAEMFIRGDITDYVQHVI